MEGNVQGWSIREAQQVVDEWIQQFEEGYWPPLANLARLIEEVGELSRELNHRVGPKKKRQEEDESSLTLEIGDVFWTLICLANSFGIDLEDALRQTRAKVEMRDRERFTRKEAIDGVGQAK